MNAAIATVLPLRRPSRSAQPRAAYNAYLLNVDFETPDGEQWSAIGGGESVAEAIAAARQSLPAGSDWDVTRWNALYGD